HLIGSGHKGLTLEPDAVNLIRDSRACGVEIELATKIFACAGMREIQPEIAEWLIRFGKQPLHLSAELVGQMIILLFEYSSPYRGEMVLRVAIVAVARLTGPQCVVVELQQLFVERSVLAASEDHRAKAAIADRQRVDPLARGLLVPKNEIVGCRRFVQRFG